MCLLEDTPFLLYTTSAYQTCSKNAIKRTFLVKTGVILGFFLKKCQRVMLIGAEMTDGRLPETTSYINSYVKDKGPSG